MCGIAGIISFHDKINIEQNLPLMAASIAHRGPDDTGFFYSPDGAMGLAHQRLAILDLTTAGHQPMSSDNNRLVIVFNGEIYNYQEIREELVEHGISFSTNSDTEVLLKAYEYWGDSCIDHFVGMYAFAILDTFSQSIFLARDRVGKKPLVYYWDGFLFAFASEIKALLQLPGIQRQLDADAIDAYLTLGYIPAPLTSFRNIFKLPPGHCLRFNKSELAIWRSWHPDKMHLQMGETRGQRIEQFRHLFGESLRLRMRSDVPIGVFLSGGIDSSVIAAECVEQGYSPKALTVAFNDNDSDRHYAAAVAHHLGIEHEIVTVMPSAIADDLRAVLNFYDEPFADSSNIPCYRIACQTKGQFKVVLNGDGGDEVFGGYRHYEYIALKQLIKRIAAGISISEGAFNDFWQTYFRSKALFNHVDRKVLLSEHHLCTGGIAELLKMNPFLRSCSSNRSLDMGMWADRHIYLPNDLLYKMDIALMSQGIEGRSPLLDHRLIEWAQRLPNCDRVSGYRKKTLLSAAYQRFLPRNVLKRPKQGFGAPIKQWLKGPLRPLVYANLPSPFFPVEPQQAELDCFYHGNLRNEGRIWALLLFTLWAENWKVHW